MDIQSLKIDLAQKILELKDQSTLAKIASVLEDSAIVAYSTNGEPLTKTDYLKTLSDAEKEIDSGDFLSHEEVVKTSNDW